MNVYCVSINNLITFYLLKMIWTHIFMNFLQYYITLCFLFEFYKILDKKYCI
jgi:hypothetical protein